MRRIALIAASVFLSLGFVLGFGIQQAEAASGNQWCDTLGYCLNAWSGGPFVKSYGYSSNGNDDNAFTIVGTTYCNGGYTTSTCPGDGIPSGWPIVEIEYTGGGSWNGRYIGDAYNESNRADSSLDVYNGYGTIFVQITYTPCGVNQGTWDVFADTHWSGVEGGIRYLAWTQNSNDGNGFTVYLNNVLGQCIRPLSPP